jgi:hypothetical protein
MVDVLEAAANLQQLVPDAGAVGGDADQDGAGRALELGGDGDHNGS